MGLEELESRMVRAIREMPSRNELRMAERKMEEDPDALQAISFFQSAQEEYGFALKIYRRDDPELLRKQKALSEAELRLNEVPIIREYNRLLKISNEPLRYLEWNLISLFQRGGRSGC